MGIEIGLGQIALGPNATYDFTSTELSAAPKAVLALLGDCGANGTPDADWRMGIGATDGTRENCAVAESTNGSGTVSVERLTRSLTCQRAVGTAVDDQLTHNAFLANGWRANLAEPGNFGKLALACMFGGSDTTVEAGRFTLSGTTQNTINFTNGTLNPNVIIFLSSGRLESTVSDNNFTPSIGFAVKDATITQRCWAMNHEHGITTSDPRQHVHTDRVIVQTVPSVYEITLDAINAGNMKLTASADSGTDEYVYLAIRFDNANLWLGDVNLPTATGVHAESGPGFQPKFVLQLSTMLTAFDVDASDATAGALALSLFNATEQFCYSWAEQDNVGTTNSQSLCNSKAMHFDAHDGTLAFDGAFSAFTPTGYEINYSTVDGTARKGFALAIGEVGTTLSTTANTAWTIRATNTRDAAWATQTAVAVPTAWTLRESASKETAWLIGQILTAFRDTAWAIRVEVSKETAWRIGTLAVSKDTAWAIRNSADKASVWAIRHASPQALAWALRTQNTHLTAWAIQTVIFRETQWRYLLGVSLSSAWAIRTAQGKDTAWRIGDQWTAVTSDPATWVIVTSDPATWIRV